MTNSEIQKHDVDKNGRTSGYVVETYLSAIESITQRKGESFVRIAIDTGDGVNYEARIPVKKFKNIANRLKN